MSYFILIPPHHVTVSSPRRADVRNPWSPNADAITVCPASGFISQNVLFGEKEQISAYAHSFVCLFDWEASVQIGGLSEEERVEKNHGCLGLFASKASSWQRRFVAAVHKHQLWILRVCKIHLSIKKTCHLNRKQSILTKRNLSWLLNPCHVLTQTGRI